MAVRVIVTGSRRWFCLDLARRVVARLVARHGDVTILNGAAPGVDTAFSDAAFEAGCKVILFPADWEKFGNGAGPIRNAEMVAAGADFAIAVHTSLRWSKGTNNCVRLCLAAGIPVYLIDSEDGEPRRVREIEG